MLLITLIWSSNAWTKGQYLTQEEYLAEMFSSTQPSASVLWLQGERKQVLQSIFNRKSVGLRVRFWQHESKSTWILEEIGKEMPITVGVTIDQSRVVDVRVLAYRESRGGEVRHDFFLNQFNQLALDESLQLNGSVDGITGATLSVRALTRVVRAALYLHSEWLSEIEN